MSHEFIFCYDTSRAVAILRLCMQVDKKRPQALQERFFGIFFLIGNRRMLKLKNIFFSEPQQ